MNLQKTALEIWIASYVRDAKAEGVVIGLSGGIDSSVVAALAVSALGKSHVYGIMMPCESTSDDQIHGQLVADWLGIECRVVDLERSFTYLRADIGNTRGSPISGEKNQLANANLKARLRMTVLYDASISRNFLVIGTGNKSELMTGYLTKYGDGGVDLEPLGEYWKSEVYALARLMEGFPKEILEKAPSAGLWEGQTDEDELGMSYDRLDTILKVIAAGENPLDVLNVALRPIGCRVTPTQIARALQLHRISEHKRHIPPAFSRKA